MVGYGTRRNTKALGIILKDIGLRRVAGGEREFGGISGDGKNKVKQKEIKKIQFCSHH